MEHLLWMCCKCCWKGAGCHGNCCRSRFSYSHFLLAHIIIRSIGGQKTWRNFLTLPNILKAFNPKLYGFSVADQATAVQKASRFNVAEPGVNMNNVEPSMNFKR